VEEVKDERLHLERVGGLDIGKATLEACVRVPAKANPGRRAQEVRSFGTPRRRSSCWPLGCTSTRYKSW
jgi:transposase